MLAFSHLGSMIHFVCFR